MNLLHAVMQTWGHQVYVQDYISIHQWPSSYRYKSELLQEVFSTRAASWRHCSSVVRDSAEDGKLWIKGFIERHDGGNISATIAVIWCRPYCDYRLVVEMVLEDSVSLWYSRTRRINYLVAFVDELMSTRYQLQAIDVIELGKCQDTASSVRQLSKYLFGHLLSKQPSSSSRGHAP
jgi:hypothetical protein